MKAKLYTYIIYIHMFNCFESFEEPFKEPLKGYMDSNPGP